MPSRTISKSETKISPVVVNTPKAPGVIVEKKVIQKKKSNEKKKEAVKKEEVAEETKKVEEVKKTSIEDNIDDSWNLVASKTKKN